MYKVYKLYNKHFWFDYKTLQRNSGFSFKFTKRLFCNENKILTHTGPNKMVNINTKSDSFRYARASCIITMKNPAVIEHIKNNTNSKGDVFRVSEIAGILAAKKTSELIPLCHQVNLNTVQINLKIEDELRIHVESYAETVNRTGVEMEAMVGVSLAALTIYDMCKAADKEIVISEVKLIEKFGGKSGHFIRNN
jgi:molybdenum cofactor biosynthesis protein MoaC